LYLKRSRKGIVRSRWVVVFLSSFLAVAGADEPPARHPVDQRPNIILVVTDDQGYGDASGYWETNLRTPAMDGIATNGVRFRQFRVNPLCAPTRASLLTGLYSLETGMWRGPGQVEKQPRPSSGWPPDARRIKDETHLIPQYLKRPGYATGVFGKWHLGHDPKNVPNARARITRSITDRSRCMISLISWACILV
jgi:arylsulfatase A-like enzyme